MSLRVLLVEDSYSDRKIFETVVESSNIECPTLFYAENFSDALRSLETHTFELVIVDFDLPDGDGLSLIREVKASSPYTPIIILTGLKDESVAAVALQEGVQDYVVKSDIFSPLENSECNLEEVGDMLVKRICYAIERATFNQQFERGLNLYASALKNCVEGLWDWDLQTNLVSPSVQWLELFDRVNSGNAQTFEDWMKFIHPDDRSEFHEALQQCFDNQKEQFSCEHRSWHEQGYYIWVLTKACILRRPTREAYRIVGSQVDITHRKNQLDFSAQDREAAYRLLHLVMSALMYFLAELTFHSGQYRKGHLLFQRAISLRQWIIGEIHADIAFCLYHQAVTYDNHGYYHEAQSLFEEAFNLFERCLGANHVITKTAKQRLILVSAMNEYLRPHENRTERLISLTDDENLEQAEQIEQVEQTSSEQTAERTHELTLAQSKDNVEGLPVRADSPRHRFYETEKFNDSLGIRVNVQWFQQVEGKDSQLYAAVCLFNDATHYIRNGWYQLAKALFWGN